MRIFIKEKQPNRNVWKRLEGLTLMFLIRNMHLCPTLQTDWDGMLEDIPRLTHTFKSQVTVVRIKRQFIQTSDGLIQFPHLNQSV